MSEPKWWPKGTIPDEAGMYVTNSGGFWGVWNVPVPNLSPSETRAFYGPLPEQPKEPTKLRRFTATKKGNLYSGVKAAGMGPVAIFLSGHNRTDYEWVQLSDLSDIQWLDKE
jgi:hypothetical protein